MIRVKSMGQEYMQDFRQILAIRRTIYIWFSDLSAIDIMVTLFLA